MSSIERKPGARGSRVMCGRYELLSRLGVGGMAEVWLARTRAEAGFERLFAVKLALPELQGDPDAAAMFLDEARLAARIHHPNVVATVDVGREGQRLWLAMEYVNGVRLVDMIRRIRARESFMPISIVLRIVVDTLRGLQAAHDVTEGGRSLGIVHRDVSPHNIMIGYDGITRLLDFGIAKANTRNAVTQRGQLKGKFGYMAPEQLVGGELTQRADIYGVGVVLWEALTSHRLVGSSTTGHSTKDLMEGRIKAPSSYRDVPSEIDRVVLSALHVDVSARPASASEFADTLERSGTPLATHSELAAFVGRLLPEDENEKSVSTQSFVPSQSQAITEPIGDPTVRPSGGRRLMFTVGLILALGGIFWWLKPIFTPLDSPTGHGTRATRSSSEIVPDASAKRIEPLPPAPTPSTLEPKDETVTSSRVDQGRSDATRRPATRRRKRRIRASKTEQTASGEYQPQAP